MGSNANQFTVALWKRERNWTELTFAETCGTVTKERKKKLVIGDRRVPSNDGKNSRGRIYPPVPFSFLQWQIYRK